jgi:hypothetical protein
MGNDEGSLGNASLWSSIVGVVLPGCLAALVAIFLNNPVLGQDPDPTYGICAILFLILQLVALGCGIAARCTASGKAGLIMSGVLLPLALGLVSFGLFTFSVKR